MYEAEVAHANKLIENLNSRNLFCEIKVIGESNKTKNPEDGVYILMGYDKNTVQNTAFNSHYMLDEYQRQDIESYTFFPKCTIFKLTNNTLATASEFCDSRDTIHLIAELFKRYKLNIPNEISQNDFLAIARAYNQSIDEDASQFEREDSAKHLEYLLKIIDSGLTQDEYDKKNGGFSLVSDKKLAKKISKKAAELSEKTVTYEPKAENCVSDEELKLSGGVYKSVNIDHDVLPMFEKEMEKYPKIKYSLVKEAKPYIYGDYGFKHWHMLTFPAQSEKIVTSVMHKYERGLEEISKKYTPGRKDIFGVEILATDFDQFYNFAVANNIRFYFDEKSVYTRTTYDRIGIVTENELNRDALVDALSGFVKAKLDGSYLDLDPVYKRQQEIQKNIKALQDSVNKDAQMNQPTVNDDFR